MGTFLADLLDTFKELLFNPASFKGRVGEKQVSRLLQTLEAETHILLNDLYIPKENGQTSQIDHIFISTKGIFVIETKNYNGWITGTETSPSWTAINYKHRSYFPNPVWQNYGHIKAVKEFLGDAAADIPFYSIVVFCHNATLKLKQPIKGADVVHIRDLLPLIVSKPSDNPLTKFRQEKIRLLLSKLYIHDRQARKIQSDNHIRNIKSTMQERKLQIANNICPRCGGHLITRIGKGGSFKGCSNYPKCRFIA
ncbi:NERD domain-containing protein [Neobacillus sp. YIM B06451]|uniref:NERD domain-containing protein n=1 Tax=Neobacillus sp. YIM B06451 TaxID=3070994 RepID=UPI00292F70A5|nr:NERD domain-containing protein [Neobacillus sp. YIM B06451]